LTGCGISVSASESAVLKAAMSSPHTTSTSRRFSPEQARDVRARAWTYVFERWQAKKGDSHDLTNGSSAETAENRPQTTESEKT
jgi:hypothetical protein